MHQERGDLLPKGFGLGFVLLVSTQCQEVPLGLLSGRKTRSGKRKKTEKNKHIARHTFQTVVTSLPLSVARSSSISGAISLEVISPWQEEEWEGKRRR